jgi:aspartate racemase
MKTVGIIGGIAPESTIQYYRLIIASYREKKQDGSYPSILINSIDMKTMLDLISKNELPSVTKYLLGEVMKLANGGADFGLLASNTPHIVFSDIRRRSPIPLISIVEATCSTAQALGLQRIALFGTRFTMQGRFYIEEFSKAGITLIAPDLEDQGYIHDKYMNELVNGIFLNETRAHLLAIVDKMRKQQGIEGLVLGGTELPLIMKETIGQPIPFLDTTKIHAEQAVAQMLS